MLSMDPSDSCVYCNIYICNKYNLSVFLHALGVTHFDLRKHYTLLKKALSFDSCYTDVQHRQLEMM